MLVSGSGGVTSASNRPTATEPGSTTASMAADARVAAARTALQTAAPVTPAPLASPVSSPSAQQTTPYASGVVPPTTSPFVASTMPSQCPTADPAIAPEPSAATLARLAGAAYGSAPPDGWTAATSEELAEIGLTPAMLSSSASDFRAAVFVDRTQAAPSFVVAFKGTSSANDWSANLRQGTGFETDHYNRALAIGQSLNAPPEVRITLTGHSLGGGLASTAALAGERYAVTFNAAGLSDSTKDRAAAIAGADGLVVTPDIRAYYVSGEILSAMQDGGDRVAGGLLGYAAAGPWGGLGGAAVADMPSAVGTRIEMDRVNPEGVHWYSLKSNNPVGWHMMDYVLASVDAM